MTLIILYSLLEVLIVLVPVLLAVAFITIIERKVLAAMQRRVGPNVTGVYGTLQPFADALKLVVKETVTPSQATRSLFFIAPVLTLIFSLIGWAVIPFGAGFALADLELGVLYTLAISSLGVYGVLFAGWSANSKYAFLGSLRSTAQIVSYELILSSAVLIVILLTGSFNYIAITEAQEAIWYIVPLVPVFLLFFIAVLAETNRTPFDLPEAESELVAGFFTEHAGIVFVFFFLGEYSSIVLISAFTSFLFLGGYNFPEIVVNNTFINIQSIVLALKTCVVCFLFVWIRATLPRLRWDQLMLFCWTILLPMAIALVLLIPSILVAFDITPTISINMGICVFIKYNYTLYFLALCITYYVLFNYVEKQHYPVVRERRNSKKLQYSACQAPFGYILLPFIGNPFSGHQGRSISTTGAYIVTTWCFILVTAIMFLVAGYYNVNSINSLNARVIKESNFLITSCVYANLMGLTFMAVRLIICATYPNLIEVSLSTSTCTKFVNNISGLFFIEVVTFFSTCSYPIFVTQLMFCCVIIYSMIYQFVVYCWSPCRNCARNKHKQATKSLMAIMLEIRLGDTYYTWGDLLMIVVGLFFVVWVIGLLKFILLIRIMVPILIFINYWKTYHLGFYFKYIARQDLHYMFMYVLVWSYPIIILLFMLGLVPNIITTGINFSSIMVSVIDIILAIYDQTCIFNTLSCHSPDTMNNSVTAVSNDTEEVSPNQTNINNRLPTSTVPDLPNAIPDIADSSVPDLVNTVVLTPVNPVMPGPIDTVPGPVETVPNIATDTIDTVPVETVPNITTSTVDTVPVETVPNPATSPIDTNSSPTDRVYAAAAEEYGNPIVLNPVNTVVLGPVVPYNPVVLGPVIN